MHANLYCRHYVSDHFSTNKLLIFALKKQKGYSLRYSLHSQPSTEALREATRVPLKYSTLTVRKLLLLLCQDQLYIAVYETLHSLIKKTRNVPSFTLGLKRPKLAI